MRAATRPVLSRHPGQTPSDEEFEEYLSYAIELRRRVKEQLNKRKNDDEFARINLGYFNTRGEEIIVSCPESVGVQATLAPLRKQGSELAPPPGSPAPTTVEAENVIVPEVAQEIAPAMVPVAPLPSLKEGELRLYHGDRGGSYRTLFFDHLQRSKIIHIEDPYIRSHYQVVNFLRFCELCVELGTVEKVTLVTSYESELEKQEVLAKLTTIENSISEHGIELKMQFSATLHDRTIRSDNGWTIKLGRGLDIYQSPEDWLEIGANDLDLRRLRETSITYIKSVK
jgi:ATP-dependent Lon protease